MMVIDFFKELCDVVIKIFEVGQILSISLVTAIIIGNFSIGKGNNFVEYSHDHIIVISILTVLESDIGVVEKVVGENFHIIDFLDRFVENSVGVSVLAEGILQ